MPDAPPTGATPAPAADATGGLADIVVTAQKRESTAQTTPIAMNVFDGAGLARNGVADLQSLSNVSPSINFAQNQAAAVITVRGISSHDDSEVGDPAVAVSVDGFYVQRPVGLNATMFDLQRIEVLRGPQGTLYGRNATGGAINIITAKPNFDGVSGYGSVNYGNYNTLNAEAALNLPLSDTLALRVAFSSRDHDGYLRLSPVQNGDDEDSKAVRAHLLWKPTDRFQLLLTGSYLRQRGVGPQGVGVPLVPNADGTNSHLKPDIPGYDHVFDVNTQGYTSVDTKTIQWNASYEFDPFTVTYLGGYSNMHFHRQTDLDGTANFSDGFQQNENPRTTNHELRIASNGNGPFKWQLGAFYFNEDSNLKSYLQTFSGNGVFNWGIFDFNVINAKSKAVFGQASYTFDNGLSLEGGVRYSDDSKKRLGTTTFFGSSAPENSHQSSDALTYHAAVNWQVTPVNLFYAKTDKGYKAGGFNNGSDYDPEYIYAYEMGTKNSLLDRRLQLNGSVFYYDYQNLQVKQFVDQIQREVIRNAGRSEIYGAELETVYQVTPADRFDFSASYLHARFKKFAISNGTTNVDLRGNRLQQAPTWSISGGYQHAFPMFNGKLIARAQSHLETETYLTIFNYASDRQGTFTKTDLSLIYQSPANWELQGYVRNVENTKTINLAVENDSYNSDFYQFGAPRTYGVKLIVNF